MFPKKGTIPLPLIKINYTVNYIGVIAQIELRKHSQRTCTGSHDHKTIVRVLKVLFDHSCIL